MLALLVANEPDEDTLGEGSGSPGDGAPVRTAGGRASLVLMGIGASFTVDGAEDTAVASDKIEGAEADGITGVESFSGVGGVSGFSVPGMTVSATAMGAGEADSEADLMEKAALEEEATRLWLKEVTDAGGVATGVVVRNDIGEARAAGKGAGAAMGSGAGAAGGGITTDTGGGAGGGMGEGSVLWLCALREGLGSGDATKGTLKVRRSAVAVGRSS